LSFRLTEHRRWLIVALLFCLSVINYLDRQTLSVLAPTLRGEMGFTTVEYSYIVTSFMVAYTIGYLFCGRALDRIGVKIGIALAIGFWSLAGMLHAAAAGWFGLAVCRFLLGLGESFNAPGGAKAIGEWIPRRERGLSMAIFSNGNIWGAIIAPPMVSFAALTFGWQWGFLTTGAVGLLWLAVWLWFYDSPEKHRAISPDERAYILQERGAEEAPAQSSMLQLLKHPSCCGMFFARLLTDPLPFFFTFWMPEYLSNNRGFTLALIGALGWIPFLAADVGGPGGGALSDWLVRRGWQPQAARLRVMLGAALMMPLSALAVRTGSAGLSLAIIALLLASHSCWIVNLLTASSEAFPRSQVGAVVALSSMGGSIGGIISNLLTGQVIAAYGYVPVFTALALLHPAAYVILNLALRNNRLGRREDSVSDAVKRPVEEAA